MHKTFAGRGEAGWTRGRQAQGSNIVRGTRQVLIEWKKHVWSLFKK